MTLWQSILDNRTKILGALATLVAGLLSMIALGMFDATATAPALLEPQAIRWMVIWLSLANLLLGGSTVAAGFSSSSAERIATADAETAKARAETAQHIMTALHTPPPEPPVAVVVAVPVSETVQPT